MSPVRFWPSAPIFLEIFLATSIALHRRRGGNCPRALSPSARLACVPHQSNRPRSRCHSGRRPNGSCGRSSALQQRPGYLPERGYEQRSSESRGESRPGTPSAFTGGEPSSAIRANRPSPFGERPKDTKLPFRLPETS